MKYNFFSSLLKLIKQATFNPIAGQFWSVAHMFDNSGLDTQIIIIIFLFILVNRLD